MVEYEGETARPGYMSCRCRGTYLGKTDVARPSDAVPQHTAPTLAMGSGGVNSAVLVNRLPLAVRNWALNMNQTMEVNDDPNTPFGFGASDISRRAARLTLDPVDTLVAVRNVIADIEAGTRYPAVVRCGAVAGNRWSLTTPLNQPSAPTPGRRGIYRTEELTLNALNAGLDPQTRDSDAVLCFY